MSNIKNGKPIIAGAMMLFFMLFCVLIYYSGVQKGTRDTFKVCKRITYLILTESNTTTETITLRFKHQYGSTLSDKEKIDLKEKNFWIEEK